MVERITTAGVAERDGLFFVAKRIPGGPLGGKWEFVGGKNRWGESVPDTLRREWKEELDLSVEPGEFLMSTDFTNNATHYTLMCHRVCVTGGEERLSVHTETAWVDRNTLSLLDFGPSDSVIRNWVLENL